MSGAYDGADGNSDNRGTYRHIKFLLRSYFDILVPDNSCKFLTMEVYPEHIGGLDLRK
jgi:hypothetical protein